MDAAVTAPAAVAAGKQPRTVIGRMKCWNPKCGANIQLRLSVRQLPYFICGSCQLQVLARGDRSDADLRASLVAPPLPAPPAEVARPTPIAAAVAALPAPPARPAFKWGIL